MRRTFVRFICSTFTFFIAAGMLAASSAAAPNVVASLRSRTAELFELAPVGLRVQSLASRLLRMPNANGEQAPGTAPDLQLVVGHQGVFRNGDAGVYTLTVSNVGTAATEGSITVVDHLSSRLTYMDASGLGWSCTAAGQTVQCLREEALAPGESTVITLTVLIGDAAPGLVNIATVVNAGDANTGNDSAADLTRVLRPGETAIGPAEGDGGPAVTMDKTDYQPGETAEILGSGFHANELITIQVKHEDGTVEGGNGHEPFTVMTDATGSFRATWFVDPDDSLGQLFRLTLECEDHLHAEMLFTDAAQTHVVNLKTAVNGKGYILPASGWWNPFHDAYNSNYIMGAAWGYRNFFAFDVPAFAGTVTSVRLSAVNPCSNATGTWTVYDVSTPLSTLMSTATSTAVWNDLGSGAEYASTFVSNPFASPQTIFFNSTGIAAVAAARGSELIVGGNYSSSGFLLGCSGGWPGAVQLVIQADTSQAATSLSVAPAEGVYGATATFEATLTSGAAPVANKTVNFYRLGTFVGSRVTNSSGVATLAGVSLAGLNAGAHANAVGASFAGDANFSASSGSGTLNINRAPATISVTGAGTFAYDGSPHAASAAVSGVFGENLGSAAITYTNEGTGATSSTQPVNPGVYRITASFGGNTNYLPGSNSSFTITIDKADTQTTIDVTGAPFGGAWEKQKSMPTARNGAPTGVVNGIIYVTGGWNGSHRTAVEAYDTVGESWTTRPDRPYPGQTNGAAAVIGDTIYIAGGTDCCVEVNSFYSYTPATDTWTSKPPMPTTRQLAVAGGVSGRFYVAGGLDSVPGAPNMFFNTLEEYNPGSNAWSTKAAMPTPRAAAAGVVLGTKFYVIGGSNATSNHLQTVEVYDQPTNTWSTVAPMPTPRSNFAVAAVGSRLFAIAGITTGGVRTATVDVYDTITNTWTTAPSLAEARAHHSMAVVNGRIYVIGGTTVSEPNATGMVERYAPVTTSTYGETITLRATVIGSVVTDGSVTFRDGMNVLGTTAVASGQATLAISTLVVGSHSLTAEYSGSTNFNASTSNNTASHTVTKANSTTTVTSSLNPSLFDESVTFTATVAAVAPGAGTLTGTVQFNDNGTPTGAPVALSGGTASLTTSAPSVGSHAITVDYSGDGNFNSSTGTMTQTVNKANSATTVTSSPNPSVFGQSVTVTATVSAVAPGTGSPSGTVQFKDNGAPIGAPVALSGGTASLSTLALSVGSHAITVDYSGDGNFNSSTGTMTQTVNKANSATTVTSSANPSVFGQSVTVTATVSAVAPGAGSPSGTVQFKDNGAPIGAPVALSGGTASLSTLALSVGSHAITVDYSGDGNFNSSTGTMTQTVNKANSATTVTSSANPSVFGQSVTVTATVVAVAPGAGTVTGTVQFKDNGAPIGAPVALSGGTASLSTSALSVGSHAITVDYSGDGNFNSSTGTMTQTVNKANSATTVTSSPNPSVFGQSVTVTATVSAVAPGAGSPSGTVQFKDNGAPIGAPVALSGGMASLSTSALSVGSHAITVDYSGDGNFNSSTGTMTQTVNKANSATTVTSSANPSVFGQSVMVMATVSAVAPGAGSPSGTVQFKDNGTPIGGPVALSSGTASLTTAALSAGSHAITAEYTGDGNFNGSAGTVTQTVNKATPTVTVNDATVTYDGQSHTVTATVTGVGGVDLGSVTLTYSPGPGEPINAGVYTVTGTYPESANYTSASDTATLTINQRAVTWTTNPASKTYGNADPTPLTTGTGTNFIEADGVAATYTRAAGETVAHGPYHITATLSATNPGALDNYTITNAGADFTITPKAASVTPDPKTKVYGDGDPELTGTLSGFLPADGVNATYARTAGESVAASPYSIGATLHPAAVLSNYATTYNTAELAITRAPLSVTADNATRFFGVNNPTFTGTITGIKNNDPITATYSTDAVVTSAVGAYTITPQLHDGESGALDNYAIASNTGTLTVAIRRTTTTVAFGSNPIAEGQTTAVTLTVTDASGLADIDVTPAGALTLTSAGALTIDAAGCTLAPTPTPGTSSCSVTLTGIDNPGGSVGASFAGEASHTGSAVTAELTVTNVAPSNVALSLSAATIVENGSITLAGSFADAGSMDSHTVVITWGDGQPATMLTLPAGVLTFSTPHQYLDDNPSGTAVDVNTIVVVVTDKDDGNGQGATLVSVNNAAPAITSVTGGPTAPQIVGSSAGFTIAFSDIGSQDSHTCRFTWDDGETTTVNAVGTGDGSCAATHAYLTPGVYTVRFQVTDDDTGDVSSIFEFVVIYDPTGGFVTGGGWIVSPAGAFAADATLTGKANFGFVSKYQTGAQVPTGQTEFQFKLANLNFHGSVYEWLVVAGAKAQYKGSGTINGAGDYGFLLTATDGEVNGGGFDRFRIKIWDKRSGAVVYDNAAGASEDIDNANPQIISGGNIVVHH